jgi:hypothetical protein
MKAASDTTVGDGSPFVLLMPADVEAAAATDGASFVEERRPGAKSARRPLLFLQLPDEDERRERRLKACATAQDEAYLNRLDHARRVLLHDEALRRVLPDAAASTSAWPSLESIKRAASLRIVSMRAAEAAHAGELRLALSALAAEHRLPGLYPIVPKALSLTEGFAGVLPYSAVPAGGPVQSSGGEQFLQRIPGGVIAREILELVCPPVPAFTVAAVVALPVAPAMVQPFVPSILREPSAGEWKRCVCDRHQAALAVGRPGVLYSVSDLQAMFPFVRSLAVCRMLALSSVLKSRLRCGLFVSILHAEELIVVFQEPRAAGARPSLKELPQLNAAESARFTAFTGSMNFETAAREELRIVLAVSSTERAENAAGRVASALSTGEPALIGTATHLSDRLWVQRVRVPGNRYLLVHGHRCQDQPGIDESLLVQLEQAAKAASGGELSRASAGAALSTQSPSAVDLRTTTSSSTAARGAGVAGQEVEEAVTALLLTRAMKFDEISADPAVLRAAGSKAAAKNIMKHVLPKIALLNADKTYVLK